MILGIRTDSPIATVVLAESNGSPVDEKTWEAGQQLSAILLKEIEDLLSKSHKAWLDLSAVVVYQGPGSFTGLRIGITVGNTLAESLDVPIVGSTGGDWFEAGLRKVKGTKFQSIVMPVYGGEANITKPKK